METIHHLWNRVGELQTQIDLIRSYLEDFPKEIEKEKIAFAQEYHAKIMQQEVSDALNKVSLTPDEIAARIQHFINKMPKSE